MMVQMSLSDIIQSNIEKKEPTGRLLVLAKNDLYAVGVFLSTPMFQLEKVLYQVQQSIEKSQKSI